MAEAYKRLTALTASTIGYAIAGTTGGQNAYQVPAATSTVLSTVVITNKGSTAATYRIGIFEATAAAVSAATATAGTIAIAGATVSGTSTAFATTGLNIANTGHLGGLLTVTVSSIPYKYSVTASSSATNLTISPSTTNGLTTSVAAATTYSLYYGGFHQLHEMIADGATVPAYDSVFLTLGLTMPASSTLMFSASSASVNIMAFGVEVA